MKRLIVAMALTAGSVFLASPASADEGTTEVTVEAASEQAPPETEEPVVEEPVVEEPVVEEPVVEEPVVEEPVVEEPVVEEPVVEEPVVEEPVVEEPVVEEPAALAAATEVAAKKAPEFSKKVFVCKYVGTPDVDEVLQQGGNPISVSINSIFPQFDGNPLLLVGQFFADAQGRSQVIAVDEGQPEPSIEACSAIIPTFVEAQPPSASDPTCDKDGKLTVPADTDEITYDSEPSGTGPGDYVVTATAAEGLTLTDDGIFEITVEEQLSGDECAEIDDEELEDVALLPDTGGEPMWMFPVGGAMALGGVLLLRATRRTATSEMGVSGNPGHSLALMPRLVNAPVKVLKEAPARVSISTSPQVRSEWAAVAGGLALAAIAVYFRSRFR